MLIGHRLTEMLSIEVDAFLTPETHQEYSALIYSGALKVSLCELFTVKKLEPYMSVAGGSYTLIGKGNRETDPVVIQRVGFDLRFSEKVSLVIEGGNLTIFSKENTSNFGFYSLGLAFVF